MGWSKDHGTVAKVNADYAKVQGDVAKQEATNLAELKTNVEAATQNASTAAKNANAIIKDANIAASNADDAASEAFTQANHAKNEGNRAKAEADRLAGTDVSKLDNKIGSLSSLNTTNKTSVVASVNEVTTQLAQSETKLSERNFLELQQKYSVNKTKPNLWRKSGARNVEFLFPSHGNDYLFYRFEKDPLDDLLKFREMAIYEKLITASNYSGVTAGAMASTTGVNHYTTTVGTIVTREFTGTEIEMLHFFDLRGGLWKASIDGKFVKNISTHTYAVAETEKEVHYAYIFARRLIAKNLTNTTHTLTLEFMGADPDNPPSSTPARGWITSDADTPLAEAKTFYVGGSITKKKELVNNASNKEFAFNLKDPSSASTNWMPEHNNIGTAFIGNTGSVKILVDNVSVNDFYTTTYLEFKEANIIQVLEVKISTDTNVRAKVYSNASIKEGVVRLKTKVEFLLPTTILAGYVNMLPVNTGAANLLTASKGHNQTITLTNDSFSELELSNPSKDFTATSSSDDYFAGVRIDDDTMPLIKNTRLQHRASIQKLYPVVFENTEVVAGESFTFGGTFYIGKMGLARELISG